MIKKLSKCDYWFIVTLFSILLFYIFLLFKVPFVQDENFYPTVPLRLINGESLIQHEWHLTQFSSLFQYLPVKLWLCIKGSSDGIMLYLRCCYLLTHTVMTVIIYMFFRKSEYWAIAAALMFYTYLPYCTFALSYSSLLVIFLIAFTLSLFFICEKRMMRAFAFSGFFFGCMCICNPLLCFIFVPYAAAVFLWPHKGKIISAVKLKKSKRKKRILQAENTNYELFDIFFTKQAFLYSCLGISVIALIAITFFFSNGGTLSSVFENIPNMINSSEYDVASLNASRILLQRFNDFNRPFLNIPLLLTLFFASVYIDKSRRKETHRFVYLIEAFFIMIIISVSYDLEFSAFPFAFTTFSITSYILTKQKNKVLFYCIWCPSMIVSIIQSLVADTVLLAFSLALAVANIAGVFFIRDLYKEIRVVRNSNKKTFTKTNILRYILLVAICFQLIYQCCMNSVEKIPDTDSVRISKGPYAGLYISATEKEEYDKTLNDIEEIQSISDEKSPVLLISYMIWPYITLNRPFATNSAYLSFLFVVNHTTHTDDLKLYYKENPDKIPEYIYLSSESVNNSYIDELTDMFIFTQQELTNGILLTVEKYLPAS